MTIHRSAQTINKRQPSRHNNWVTIDQFAIKKAVRRSTTESNSSGSSRSVRREALISRTAFVERGDRSPSGLVREPVAGEAVEARLQGLVVPREAEEEELKSQIV